MIFYWILHAGIFLSWYRIHFVNVNAKCKPTLFIFLQMEMAYTFLSLFSSPLPPSLLSRGALKQVALAVPLLVLFV